MDAIACLKTRRSVRAFAARPVARELIEQVVDAARLAPTAMNQQVWEFVAITDPAMMQKLGGLIEHAKFLPTTPAAVAVLIKDNKFAVEDGAAATLQMLLAAHALGLGSVWVSGDKQPYADAVRTTLGAPADCRFFSLVALGYANESPNPEKRTLADVIHWERF